MGPIAAPEALAASHDVSRFNSGVPSLDGWLQGKARLNEATGGARTYVACDGDRMAGCYKSCRKRGGTTARAVPGWQEHVRAGAGDPARTACGRRGVPGTRTRVDLLVDARRALSAADVIGARAVVVQALNEHAKSFYTRFGFRRFSDREPLILLLRISELRALFQV